MTRAPEITLALCLLALGCSPPVEAPTEFDELCSFIFTHADDEDERSLAEGIVNLQNWLAANRTEVEEGYMVDNLDEAVVQELDGAAHDLTDLLGVAFAARFDHGLNRSLAIELGDDPEVRRPEMWKRYNRTVESDLDCFLEGRCDTLDYNVEAEQIYPMGLEAEVSYHARLRRLETDAGTAIIWRTWLNGPNQFNWDWVKVKLNFYLGVAVETQPGRMERTEASWMLANMGDSPVPHDVALSLALDTIKAGADRLRTRLAEEHGGPETP
jgi:hypothetical protein